MLAVYNLSRQRVAILENAIDIAETHQLNAIWQLTFSIPADDPKNDYLHPMHYVRWEPDGELYRILPIDLEQGETGLLSYECEHVIATLMDNVLFGYHQIGNIGVFTRTVLQYVLDKQIVKNWVLDVCAFNRQFEYAWEQENLLSALFSVPKCFNAEYIWTWDTSTYPWRLSLRELDLTSIPALYIRASKNMLKLTRRSDPKNLCTRLYPLGYGEGVNQLGIKELNNGVPYLQSPPNIVAKYGIIERVWVDRRYHNQPELLGASQSMLRNLQTPFEQYSVEFTQIRGDPEHINVGSRVRIHDPGNKVDMIDTIVQVTVFRDKPGGRIEVANASENIAQTVADLADRQRVETTYSQGATQIYSVSVQDNADNQNGLRLDFYIPPDMIHVNRLYCKIRMESFRAYSKATESGGQISTTPAGGGTTSSAALSGTTASGGGGSATVNGGGIRTSSAITLPSQNIQNDDLGGTNAKNHNHGLFKMGDENNMYLAIVNAANTIVGHTGYVPSGAHIHGAHDHTIDTSFQVQIPAHTHGLSLSHSHDNPSHTHQLDTRHGHEITPGIYRSGSSNSFTVKVNGIVRQIFNETSAELDILPWLIGNDGMISRGTWHNVEVVPNGLAYISNCAYIQGFIQSRGEVTV